MIVERPITVELVNGSRGLESIIPVWNELKIRLGVESYLDEPGYWRAVLETLEQEPERWWFCLVRSGQQVSGIIPLGQKKKRIARIPLRTLSGFDHDHLPFTDWLIAPDLAPAPVFEGIRKALGRTPARAWDAILIPRTLATSRISRFLNGYSTREVINQCDILPVLSPQAMLEHISSNLKGNLRKSRNKLVALPDWRFETANCACDLQHLLQEHLSVEASGWKGNEHSAIASDPHLVRFYSRLTEEFEADQKCQVRILRVGETPVASQFGLLCGETLFLFKIGYREEYAKYSPGNLLIEKLNTELESTRQARSINLISSAPWHSQWRPNRIEIVKHLIYRGNFWGMLGSLARKVNLYLSQNQVPVRGNSEASSVATAHAHE